MPYDVLQLQEVGDFGDENCLPPLNLIRSTKLHLTTEPPISCRCCYKPFFFCRTKVSLSLNPSFFINCLNCFLVAENLYGGTVSVGVSVISFKFSMSSFVEILLNISCPFVK